MGQSLAFTHYPLEVAVKSLSGDAGDGLKTKYWNTATTNGGRVTLHSVTCFYLKLFGGRLFRTLTNVECCIPEITDIAHAIVGAR